MRNRELDANGALLEAGTVKDLAANFLVLRQSLLLPNSVVPQTQNVTPARAWTSTVEIFDQFEGNDLREVLQAAITRQRTAAVSAEGALNTALAKTRQTSAALAAIAFLLGGFAVFYFVRQLQRPFADVLHATDAIAADRYDDVPNQLSARHDEFGRIGQHLESMAAKLASARRENEAVRAGLDATVASRTEALTRVIESLLPFDETKSGHPALRLLLDELDVWRRRECRQLDGDADLREPNRMFIMAAGDDAAAGRLALFVRAVPAAARGVRRQQGRELLRLAERDPRAPLRCVG
ncbi:MAG: hypothetical protein HC782_02900, partial [Gammaproteobacteria bacterium]|nr:hypothetical protein [Gammaproteobacteria bacterium]